ncbi:MAG TPA: PQQ-binding-like beta-propeller repeat protein [Opitutaceae bacterium]|nr:PQQ-binding-like beta-propeller repeat protein [Opitutaceae bacterium]
MFRRPTIPCGISSFGMRARWWAALLAGSMAASVQAADGAWRWTYSFGNTSSSAIVESSPAMGADGTLYVGVDYGTTPETGAVVAIIPNGTADTKWWVNTPGAIEASPTVGPDGTVYVGSIDGRFYAFDPTTGSAKWTFDTNTATIKDAGSGLALPTYIHSSAAVSADGKTIYVGVGAFGVGANAGPAAGALYALSDTGRLLWTKWFGNTVESSPVIGPDGTVYIGSWDTKFYAINSDGTEKWHHAFAGQIWGSAAIGGDGTIYVGSIGNDFAALTPTNQVKWQAALTVPGSAAIGADGTVYVGNWTDSSLYALDAAQGTTKWTAQGQPAIGSTPTVRGDGVILAGGEDGSVRAYSPTDGSVLWRYVTGDRVTSAPLIATTPDHGIYFGSWDGHLYALSGNTSPISSYASWPTFQHDASHSGREPPLATSGKLLNISTRGIAGPAANLIVGFVIGGQSAKSLLVRAAGPTLAQFGISAPLADPRFSVQVGTKYTYVSNDNWADNSNATDIVSTSTAIGAFPFSAASKDAAVLWPFPPAQLHSEVVSSATGPAGTVLGEVYDASPNDNSAHLVNLSSRGFVGTGDNVLIAGVIIGGDGPLHVLIRAVGPGLAQYGVTDALAAPTFVVRESTYQTVVGSNTGWMSAGLSGDISAAESLTGAFALTEHDSAAIFTLDPGGYTIMVSGADGGTGEGLVEVYVLPH